MPSQMPSMTKSRTSGRLWAKLSLKWTASQVLGPDPAWRQLFQGKTLTLSPYLLPKGPNPTADLGQGQAGHQEGQTQAGLLLAPMRVPLVLGQISAQLLSRSSMVRAARMKTLFKAAGSSPCKTACSPELDHEEDGQLMLQPASAGMA